MLKNYSRIKSCRKADHFRRICVLFSILFLVGCVFLAIQATLVFSKIASLEKEENRLVQERSFLQERLFKADSLNNAVLLSGRKGFTGNVRVIYLSGRRTVAKLP